MTVTSERFYKLLQQHEAEILTDWMKEQMSAVALRVDLMKESELQQQSREFLRLLIKSLPQGDVKDIQSEAFNLVRQFLNEISSTRATQGFSPVETAIFIFSLKQAIFKCLNKLKDAEMDNQRLLEEVWMITTLIDNLGLYTFEQYQKAREDVISRQQQEMLELSTPVVKLWEGILILPLIGTLDSSRTQQIMESLLQKIVETSSSIAIIDITGIPTVDTLVAQHLIKAISAARLMGADCIVSGIRPQIAQTIVHLGISLQHVITKSTLEDAVGYAMQKVGFKITR